MIFTSSPTLWEQMYTVPLSQRIGIPPDEVVQFVAQYNASVGSTIVPTVRNISDDFLLDAQAAIEELPTQVQAHLETKLLAVFFLEGLVSSAFTTLIAYANGDLLGAIVVLDARTFAQASANEWATWRESTAFAPTSYTQLNVRIASDENNTRKIALQYELLHEFGHVIASGSRFMPRWWKAATAPEPLVEGNFLKLSWQAPSASAAIDTEEIRPLASQDFESRAGITLYKTPSLKGEQIAAVYESLAKTAFPTLYAASHVQEDFAESFVTYVHTVLLQHPHEVRISHNGAPVAVHERFWDQPRAQGKRGFFERMLSQPPEPLPRQHIHLEVAQLTQQIINLADQAFLGLAPFLRLSVESGDLRHIAQTLIARLGQDENNAPLWMNASTVFYSVGEHGLGESMQQQGLSITRQYEIPAFIQPAKCRVLMLMATGDIAENTPLDCLLEFGAVDLIFYYVSEEAPLPLDVPDHDVLFVAVSESDKNHRVLKVLEPLLANWHKPVINAPKAIPNSERNTASVLFQDVAGLQMPYTYRISREQLAQAAAATSATVYADCVFPVILRPVGSHAGRDLIRADSSAEIEAYLPTLSDDEFYISRFIDYSGNDGLFRKFRVVLIDGVPFIGHMAVSSDWMIHYVNAGMYQDAAKRAEEERFMDDFPTFAARHKLAFDAIHNRSGLDYLCIDCAETQAGELLIFEIGNAMVIHDMDPPDLFPYKSRHMQQAKAAVEELLHKRMAGAQNSGKMSNT